MLHTILRLRPLLLSLLLVLAQSKKHAKGPQDNKQEKRPYGTYGNLTHADIEARPFSLESLVALREATGACGPDKGPAAGYGPGDVTNLAIARTGSESVTKAMRRAGQPGHHNHDCTLAALAALGARRAVVSIRHPVARLVSGYQRRMETASDRAGTKRANRDYVAQFRAGGLEEYVSALRLPAHPKHAAALAVTYGNERQSYM
jgi:hypothetical protein